MVPVDPASCYKKSRPNVDLRVLLQGLGLCAFSQMGFGRDGFASEIFWWTGKLAANADLRPAYGTVHEATTLNPRLNPSPFGV